MEDEVDALRGILIDLTLTKVVSNLRDQPMGIPIKLAIDLNEPASEAE